VSQHQVPQPILNSPYEEPKEHWELWPGKAPVRADGRRKALYWYRPPSKGEDTPSEGDPGTAIELILVNRIRERVKAWRSASWIGASRTTLELLQHWRREGRQHRLFFAQVEAVETILFMTEARADFRQGIEIPRDDPSEERRAEGYGGFRRFACKMATGSGKTTVMGMLAAWSILNKVHSRGDARFSDVVLVVCPNVTIRSRLAEIDPRGGEASLYRKRDLVPAHLMADLAQGFVLVTNWHVFEPRDMQSGGISARVMRAGRATRVVETIRIGEKTTSARGKKYLTVQELERQIGAGLVSVLGETKDKHGNIISVQTESWRYLESDTALVKRVLGRDIGGKRNLLVLNDEAHHAYRKRRAEAEQEVEDEEEEDADRVDEKEATVWIEGLDRVNKLRGINVCIDLSATPYYLSGSGPEANRPFPWVVSDFGLTDAIESGLVKIPQLAVRDTTGSEIPGYYNIWRWVQARLTSTERGGRRASPKPEAVVKWAQPAIASLAGLWEAARLDWDKDGEARPPVFILVCKNTKISKVVFDWIAEGKPPFGIPDWKLASLANRDGRVNTIRVDTKVVHETDGEAAKSDENAWMRFTLDTVGRLDWPRDAQSRPLYPEGFESLAEKLKRPTHPPGRDIRCIVSVGMLTEGWDCNTVTHIIGLRPFMSQLLCEQVVGRALRRRSYEVGEGDLLSEEVAQVLGVPFEVIPLKESAGKGVEKPPPRHHVHALPTRTHLELRFPRVEGYTQAIRNRIQVDWNSVPKLILDPQKIPPETQLKAMMPGLQSRPSLLAPGGTADATIAGYIGSLREQELAFDLARGLTDVYCKLNPAQLAPHVLFPQVLRVVQRFLVDCVVAIPPWKRVMVGISPYYGLAIERLAQAIRPDTGAGEVPEIPRYETSRGPGSTSEVDYWTSKDVREVEKSHLNYVVADTKRWEQSAAYFLDRHPSVESFAKNAGLGFAIPYIHNGEPHDYVPDFLVRLVAEGSPMLVLETKGYDELKDVKVAAARRWVAAVNADGGQGRWAYAVISRPTDVGPAVENALVEFGARARLAAR
jgi:type III restriction enzyme